MGRYRGMLENATEGLYSFPRGILEEVCIVKRIDIDWIVAGTALFWLMIVSFIIPW